MLSIPLKRGNTANLSNLLRDFLKKEGFDQPGFEEDINSLHQIRQAAVTAVDCSDISLQYFLRYSYHLSSLVVRLSTYENAIKWQLNWLDAFRSSKSFNSPSLYYDWASILWNVAALESQKGTKVERENEEGIRIACKHFQQAASIFKYVKENIMREVRGGTTPDLSDDGLEMAKVLMLAQAQMCYYEKALRDHKASGTMKPVILAKLANQVASFYKTAYALGKGGAVAASLDVSWYAHMDFQAKMFEGVAQYWGSVNAKQLASQRGTGYGEEIGRLVVSERLLLAALETVRIHNLTPALRSAPEHLLQVVRKSRGDAERDNKAVYLEAVPAESALADLGAVPMAQTGGLPEYYCNDQPLFKSLMSKLAKEAQSRYEEALDGLVSVAVAEGNTASSAARTQLSSIGLPASLESFKSGGGMPEGLWLKISRIQSLGGVEELRRKVEALQESAGRSRGCFESIERSLQREETTDAAFRARSPGYVGASSATLNHDVKRNRDRLLEAFHQARDSDIKIQVELEDSFFRENKDLLSKPRIELDQILSKIAVTHEKVSLLDLPNDQPTVDTSGLEEELVKLASILEQREQLLTAMRALKNEDRSQDILKESQTNTDAQTIVHKFLEPVEAFNPQLAALLQQQQSSLARIVELNEKFTVSRRSDPVTAERENFFKKLEQLCTKFFSLHAQLSGGCTFYADLQAKLSAVLQSADDLSYTQQLLRGEFEMNLARSYDQDSQEMKDREYAAQLAQELSAVAVTGGSQGKQLLQGTAVGVPVAGPPQAGAAPGRPLVYKIPTVPPANPRPPTNQNPFPSSHPQSNAALYSTPAYPSMMVQGPPPVPPAPTLYHLPQYPGHGGQPLSQPYPQQAYQSLPAYGPPANTQQSYSPSVIQSGGSGSNSDVARLVEMGFPIDRATIALQAANGNADEALNILLSQPDPSLAPQPSSGTARQPAGNSAPPSIPSQRRGYFGF